MPTNGSEFFTVSSGWGDPRHPPSSFAEYAWKEMFDPVGMAPISVLLVDDDFELGQMLTEYLATESFSVITACDGGSALKLAEKESFALVILDVMLPSLNGFDVLRTLRRTQSVPVIMLTARGARLRARSRRLPPETVQSEGAIGAYARRAPTYGRCRSAGRLRHRLRRLEIERR
jgi:CheY-like chemotaxis protein